ncbi:MAG: MlaD family protein [Polyangiaceae bacterium]
MKRAWWLGLLLFGASSCEEVTGPSGYLATFDDVAGLKPGGPVYVAGVKVGRIKSVGLEEGKAKVELIVESQHDIAMTSAACVSVGRYAFDTETHLTLVPSKDGAPLGSGDALTCVDDGNELSEKMEKVSSAMVAVLEAALDGKGTIGRLLTDPDLADQVVRFFQNGPPQATKVDDDSGDGGADDSGDDAGTEDAEKPKGADDGAKANEPERPAPAVAPKPKPAPKAAPADLKDPFD